MPEVSLAAKTPENAALIALMLQDPQRGAAALFRQFSTSVKQWVLRIAGPDSDHNDIVQLVFCRLIDTIHQVREPQKLEAWVRAVTVNVVLQELRKRRFRQVADPAASEPAAPNNFVQDLEARDLLRRARRLIERMPASERVVFILFHVEAEPLASIATICGFSVPTAKRRLAKANRRFQQLIEREPELRQFSVDREARRG